MQTPFRLEIQIPGREATVIKAAPGQALAKEMDLAPATVSIGVEKCKRSDEGISARVLNQLGTSPLIKVVGPDMLEAIRKEIENQKEKMRTHPMAQMAIRAMGREGSLGLGVEFCVCAETRLFMPSGCGALAVTVSR